jgi:hypothetical protein
MANRMCDDDIDHIVKASSCARATVSQLPYEKSSWKFLKEANCWGLTGGTYNLPGDGMAASATTVP